MPIHGFSLLQCIGNDPNNPSLSAVREFLISLGARPKAGLATFLRHALAVSWVYGSRLQRNRQGVVRR
jgi:hypothetical protein